jgi:hypothetical protein
MLLLTIVAATALVMTVSAGTIGTSGSTGSAGVTGNGFAMASMDWDAEYAAGFDLVGQADGPGDHFSTSMSGTDTQGNDDITVMVKASQMKISGSVCGPGDGDGFAMAIASIRALANRGMDGDAAVTDDGGLTLETWIFANTHTYAGTPGVTATASASASGTATANGETPDGSAMAESKGKVTAASSATYPYPCEASPDSLLIDGGSSSVSAAMIGAASHAEDGSFFAGYPSYMTTPISLFHPFPPFDQIVYPYFYPGNGLATANVLEGTGYAKSSASGSAIASADMPVDFTGLGSGCEPVFEPVVKTYSSGTADSGVSGTETMAGAVSGINAWAFALNEVEDGALQEGYEPTAALDTGSTIFAAGGVIDEALGSGAVSTSGKKSAKPVTVDTASFSASGKTSGMINIGPEFLDGESVSQFDGLVADLDASSSGSISGKVTQDGGGQSGSVNGIAARALGYPGTSLGWGILLPAVEELNIIAWDLGAEEGQLYSMLGSASGSMECGGGTGTTAVTVSGSALASGEGSSILLRGASVDGGDNLDDLVPESGIAGTTSAKGTIKSSTTALPFGDAATTSQILATGGEPLGGVFAIDYYDFEDVIGFGSEVGGMAYLTTMDYAFDKGIVSGTSGTSKSKKCPVTSATSTVTGQADFKGSSVIIDDVLFIVPVDLGTANTGGIVLVAGEDHEASASSKGTVTGSASAKNLGEADTGSLIFSASAAELNTEGLDDAVVDYSLILSDSSAMSGGGQTASAKGSADGTTTASSQLIYTGFGAPDGGFEQYRWVNEAESTTNAKGKITTQADASGNSLSHSAGELKSYNEVQPASVEVFYPGSGADLVIDGPSIINDDSVLVSGVYVNGSGSCYDRSSATASVTGSTSSVGDQEIIVEELLTPDGITTTTSKPPKEVWVETDKFSVEGQTSVSNSDTATAKGSGKLGDYEGQAFNFACADQMTNAFDGPKTALAQGIFGSEADNLIPGSDVTAQASISNVKINAYADPIPLDAIAKVNYNGGKASAKITPTTATAPPATYSSLNLCVVPPYPIGGTDAYGQNGANPGAGYAYAFQSAIADSNNPTPTAGNPPGFPDILNPVMFWS